MAQDPYEYFRLEARDLQEQLAKGVLELEKTGSTPAAIQRQAPQAGLATMATLRSR